MEEGMENEPISGGFKDVLVCGCILLVTTPLRLHRT